jgi:hypothetical protein
VALTVPSRRRLPMTAAWRDYSMSVGVKAPAPPLADGGRLALPRGGPDMWNGGEQAGRRVADALLPG